MGSHSSKNDTTGEVNEELPPNSPPLSQPQPAPTPPRRQLEFELPQRATCDHGWSDGPAFIPPFRELTSDDDEDEIVGGLNNLTLADPPNISTHTTTNIAATTFPRFLELPTEVQMLIFRQAVETSIGPVRRDSFFSDDLWYTETSLFSGGCTNYPHYMTYHNGGVGAILPPCPPLRPTRQWVGIGSKVIFKDIMHANGLSRQAVFEYWKEAVGKCLGEYVRGDKKRKGMDLDGRPINYWMMQALKRRELVLEVLGELLRDMRGVVVVSRGWVVAQQERRKAREVLKES